MSDPVDVGTAFKAEFRRFTLSTVACTPEHVGDLVWRRRTSNLRRPRDQESAYFGGGVGALGDVLLKRDGRRKASKHTLSRRDEGGAWIAPRNATASRDHECGSVVRYHAVCKIDVSVIRD